MSRTYIGFLAACLTAAASALFSSQAAAQQQPTAIAIDPVVATEIAQSMDEAAFKQRLVANSPWLQSWKTISRNGTVELSFSIGKDGNLTGKLFNFKDKDATDDTPMKDISVKGSELRFVNARSHTVFTYRLNSDDTMSGTFEGTSSRGNRVEGTMKATPASGAKK